MSTPTTEPTGAGSDTSGLREKYRVRRTDQRDLPGLEHHNCRLFVLDMTHDPHARAAIRAYADSAAVARPALAGDLLNLVAFLDDEEPLTEGGE